MAHFSGLGVLQMAHYRTWARALRQFVSWLRKMAKVAGCEMQHKPIVR